MGVKLLQTPNPGGTRDFQAVTVPLVRYICGYKVIFILGRTAPPHFLFKEIYPIHGLHNTLIKMLQWHFYREFLRLFCILENDQSMQRLISLVSYHITQVTHGCKRNTLTPLSNWSHAQTQWLFLLFIPSFSCDLSCPTIVWILYVKIYRLKNSMPFSWIEQLENSNFSLAIGVVCKQSKVCCFSFGI